MTVEKKYSDLCKKDGFTIPSFKVFIGEKTNDITFCQLSIDMKREEDVLFRGNDNSFRMNEHELSQSLLNDFLDDSYSTFHSLTKHNNNIRKNLEKISKLEKKISNLNIKIKHSENLILSEVSKLDIK